MKQRLLYMVGITLVILSMALSACTPASPAAPAAATEAPAEVVLSSVDFHPDAVIVDPPRSGLEGAALDGLLRQQPQWLAYVSCDPATLARDARRLAAGGYRLTQITPLDLFPQTYHIESISLFEK